MYMGSSQVTPMSREVATSTMTVTSPTKRAIRSCLNVARLDVGAGLAVGAEIVRNTLLRRAVEGCIDQPDLVASDCLQTAANFLLRQPGRQRHLALVIEH